MHECMHDSQDGGNAGLTSLIHTCGCREHFNTMQVHNACYAHAWDASSTKLMSVGGPLPYGLRGCYMGLWD